MDNINYKELVGKTFGYLTILEVFERCKGATLKVKCKCEKEIIKSASRVLTGHCKSCGCRDFPRLHRTKPIHSIIEPNCKYGRLTTISKETKKGGSDISAQAWWLCKCDCNNIKEIRETHIKYGNVVSCGCMRIGTTNPRWKGYNEISTRYYRSIKNGAKKRGFSFNITYKDMWDQYLKQNKKCALSGLPIYFSKRSGCLKDGNASLDRIDSSKGYESDNIQWLEKRLNTMKMDCSQKDFIDFCYLIVDRQNKKTQEENLESSVIDYII